MGIPYSELDHFTPRDFNLYSEGYQQRELAQWERTRFAAWMTQAVATEKPLTIEQVLPLPTDKARQTEAKKAPKIKRATKKEYNKALDYFNGN